MAEELTELTEEMKAAIGSTGPVSSYEVTTQGIRTFARAVGYRDSVYYDEEAAKAKGHRALPAPPGFFGMPKFNPAAPRARGGRRFRSPFRRALNGGSEVEPLEQVYAGDELEAVTPTSRSSRPSPSSWYFFATRAQTFMFWRPGSMPRYETPHFTMRPASPLHSSSSRPTSIPLSAPWTMIPGRLFFFAKSSS